jgi:hypothetical protein
LRYTKTESAIEQAYEKRDIKMVDELTQKIATLEKTLGPELLALVVGLQDIDPNDKLGAEIVLELETINRLCTR